MSARAAPPCTLVIFGATGDLSRRKLLPALRVLSRGGLLRSGFRLLGVSTATPAEAGFARAARGIAGKASFLSADFRDDRLYARLKERLRGPALFYLAAAPDFFAPIAERLAAAGLLQERLGFRRLIVEKPFGRDLASARALNAELAAAARERQIYRIDHYLGKETVQNLLVLRFGNSIFEPVWNRGFVDHVQLTVAEYLGVERRGRYYDASGALRDMIPSHILQLLSLLAMEPPSSLEAGAVRQEQVKLLRAIAPPGPADVVRGQYRGYRAEPSVARGSRTETFVALRLFIENWRWAGVPFFCRTGKRLPQRATELVVQFRRAPLGLFSGSGLASAPPNQIVVRIQPDEGVALRFAAKVPGPAMTAGSVDMDFRYEEYFGGRLSAGYERLLHDAMIGDQTLFRSAEGVEAGWAVVEPLLRSWSRSRARPRPYAPGTWGPLEADALLGRPWRCWRACAR